MEDVFKGSKGWKALYTWNGETGSGSTLCGLGFTSRFLGGHCVSSSVTNQESALFVFAVLIRRAAALCAVLQSELYIGRQWKLHVLLLVVLLCAEFLEREKSFSGLRAFPLQCEG